MASLPDTPFHLSIFCPQCHKPLRRIKSKRNDEFFLGCTGYPTCRFTESYDEALQDFFAWLGASLDVDLKKLIALSHPDRWPNNPLAHEVTACLNTLRTKTRDMLEGALT